MIRAYLWLGESYLREMEHTPLRYWPAATPVTMFVSRNPGDPASQTRSAVEYAFRMGARYVEACPKAGVGSSGSSDLFVGKTSVFLQQGFSVIEERGNGRSLVRIDFKC